MDFVSVNLNIKSFEQKKKYMYGSSGLNIHRVGLYYGVNILETGKFLQIEGLLPMKSEQI